MPFTPSHAIVALPFVRSPLIPAAIAIGAMTPDLPLFVRFGVPRYGMTHDLRWLPVTVLFALALLLVWRCVLRPAVRALSPSALARRLPASWDQGARASLRETFPSGVGVLWLALSLVLGVASHIVWDAFTHDGRGGGELLPVLQEQWGPWHGYRWLQYASTAIGLVVLAIAAILWLRRRRDQQEPAKVLPLSIRVIWWLSLPVILVLAWLWGVVQFGPFDGSFTVRHLAYLVLPPACGVWASLTLLLCVVTPALVRRTHSPQR